MRDADGMCPWWGKQQQGSTSVEEVLLGAWGVATNSCMNLNLNLKECWNACLPGCLLA